MNPQVLTKYNIPVPRYTSYPPATFFRDSYTAADYLRAVEDSNHCEPQQISLYFHIPFCRSICFYCGCTSLPMPDNQTVRAYVEALKAEIKLVSCFIDPGRQVSQVHFGGGTPNALPAEYLVQIMEEVSQAFSFTPTPEIAIECNPAYLDIPYMQSLLKVGFNRFSLGIQDFNGEVLTGVRREPSLIPVKNLIEFLKNESPFNTVNLDFIYGLPLQTIAGFVKTIQKAIDCRPDRLVAFSYAHVPWVNKFQKILEERGLPAQDEKMRMFESASQLLIHNGYKSIGLDHFVREEDELFRALKTGTLHRNFQGYCTRSTTGQVYAFGVSAISQLFGAYAQNTKSVGEYLASVHNGLVPICKGYALDPKDTMVREVITEIMCNKQLHWEELATRCSTSVSHLKETVGYDGAELKKLADDGLILFSDEGLTVTEDGGLFIRNVASCFDPLYYKGNQKYSKPV